MSTVTDIQSYLYGQAIGSIFFSPISESFGRKPLYIVAMFLDSGLEIIIGTVPHIWSFFLWCALWHSN
jgi:MFS family permease